MERKKLWKRGLSAGLATLMVMIAGLSPLPEGLFSMIVRAEEKTFPVYQSELALNVNVIPEALSNNKNFMNDYVRNGAMSLNSYFKFSSQSNSNKTSGELEYENKMMHKKKGNDWKVSFKWTNITEQQRQIFEDSSYDLRYEGNVISEEHDRSYIKGVYLHQHEGWDRAEVGLRDSKGTKWTKISSCIDSGAAQKVNWSSKSFHINGEDWLEFYAKSVDCRCGESATSGNVFYMVDTTSPRITDTYICTDSGKPSETKLGNSNGVSVASGIKNYIVFEFSEKVRFSDNAGGEIELDLDAFDTNTGIALDEGTLKAKLISFSNNRMIFEYTVPSMLNEKATNIYITGISSTQTELVNGSFPLNLYKGDGSIADTGNQRSSCYITDIAGNSIDWSKSDKSTGKVYYDNVAPTMKDNISMKGSMITSATPKATDDIKPDEINRSSMFAGEGDWVEFEISFSENIKVNTNGQMYMVLNLKDPDGNYIKLACNHSGGNKIKSSRLNFTDGMLAEDMAGQKIYVTGLEGIASITDNYGNIMGKGTNYSANLSEISVKPAQQIFVDMDAPEIRSVLVPDENGVYTPTASADELGEYFTFPIIIEEYVPNDVFTSQVEPQLAGIALVQELQEGEAGMNFGWYVDFEPKVDPGKFQTGTTVSTEVTQYTYVPLNGKTAYLHVKPDKNSVNGYRIISEGDRNGVFADVNIFVTVNDNAGNVARNIFPVTYLVDRTLPIISIDENEGKNVNYSVDYKALTSSITTNFSIKEDFGIKEIKYYWTYTTTNASGVTETRTTEEQVIDLSGSWEKEYKGDTTVDNVI